MNEIKDLTGLGEPAAELIKAVRAAVGDVFRPWQIRREARAKADETRIQAGADAEAAETAARAFARISHREFRRQRNLEAITAKALQELPPALPKEKPEEDWLAEIVNRFQDVGNEEMQSLWAKILAGEFTKPGSYSRRTLAVVGTMSRGDAELFTQVASYVWWFDDTDAHLLTFGELPFDLSVRNHLETIGLLEDTSFPGLLWGAPAREYSLRHHNRVYRMALEADLDRNNGVPILPLTQVGRELVGLAGGSRIDAYEAACIEGLKSHGFKFE